MPAAVAAKSALTTAQAVNRAVDRTAGLRLLTGAKQVPPCRLPTMSCAG